jgi:hypothetical protein
VRLGRGKKTGTTEICRICRKSYYRPEWHKIRGLKTYCSKKCWLESGESGQWRRVPRMKRNCQVCGREFETKQNLISIGKGKFCSQSCSSKIAVLPMLKRIKAGEWKDISRASIAKLHAAVASDETLHWKWKGEGVGYYGVHDWITKHFGQPMECEVCGLNDPKRKYHWANLSHKYRRDRSDFKRMCVSCHRKYDYAAARSNKELGIAS